MPEMTFHHDSCNPSFHFHPRILFHCDSHEPMMSHSCTFSYLPSPSPFMHHDSWLSIFISQPLSFLGFLRLRKGGHSHTPTTIMQTAKLTPPSPPSED
ncbi:uncharacterized protein BDV14DRAFT_153454 [Aspergillus stella-maris]|uniref:uncharacterized protein n=1 Tax=Aspergillus stella-maris TaxID=1810926 RepID=UPI003CCDBD0E